MPLSQTLTEVMVNTLNFSRLYARQYIVTGKVVLLFVNQGHYRVGKARGKSDTFTDIFPAN